MDATRFDCKRCGNFLAFTTPAELRFPADNNPTLPTDGCAVRQTVTLVCRKCGASRKWRPSHDAA